MLKEPIVIDPATKSHWPVALGNHLVLTNSTNDQRRGMDNDDRHYDEVTPDGTVVARYHEWHHLHIHPPQRTDAGWKKFDLQGQVITSG